jgi:hypothetical protein
VLVCSVAYPALNEKERVEGGSMNKDDYQNREAIN